MRIISLLTLIVLLLLPLSDLRGEDPITLCGSFKDKLRLPSISVNIAWSAAAEELEERSLESPLAALARAKRQWRQRNLSASQSEKIRWLFELRDHGKKAGKDAEAQGYNQRAIDLLAEEAKKTPQVPHIYFSLGKAFYWKREYSLARKNFLRSYALDPDQPSLYRHLLPSTKESDYMETLKKWEALADNYYEKKMELQPKEPSIYYQYGLFQVAVANRYSNAPGGDAHSPAASLKTYQRLVQKKVLITIQKAVTLDPDVPQYRLLRASLLLGKVFFRGFFSFIKIMNTRSREDLDQNIFRYTSQCFGEAVKKDPQTIQIIEKDLLFLYQSKIFGFTALFSYLGLLEKMRGNLSQAEKYYYEGIQYHRDYREFYWELASLYVFFYPKNSVFFHQHSSQMAQRMLKNPSLAMTTRDYLLCIKSFENSKRYKEALEVADRALKKDPRNPMMALCKAVILLKKGKREEGRTLLFSIPLQYRDIRAYGLYNRGVYFLMEGQPKEGVPLIIQAHSLDPSIDAAKYILIMFGL